jgi:flagellar basal-body rod modification protein FlgD
MVTQVQSQIPTTGSNPGTQEDSRRQVSATKEEFLLLLVTQLQHQDPLNPMEAREFTAQLAQFSLLEQALQTNEYLKALSLYEASANNARAVDLLGKEIVAKGDQVFLGEDGKASLYFRLAQQASATNIYIYDSTGRIVRVIEAGALPAGDNSVTWDGRDHSGGPLPPGAYRVEVKAKDTKGQEISVEQYLRGKASSASFKEGATSLLVDGIPVPLGSILEVHG